MKYFNFGIFIFIILAVAAISSADDYYVDAVNGSNENSGASPEDALQSITDAISRIPEILMDTLTINIAEGTYDLNNDETFPIELPGKVTLKGVNREVTIIDASGSSYPAITIIEKKIDLCR